VEERSERHRKDWFARAGPERKTRRLVPGASREIAEGDAEAGSEGWTNRSGRRKPNVEENQPEGGFEGASRRIESPGFRPEEVGRYERRKPQGRRRE